MNAASHARETRVSDDERRRSSRPCAFLASACALALAVPCAALAANAPPPRSLSLGTLWFVSLQDVDQGDHSDRELLVKRGHFDLQATLSPRLRFRLTPDLTRDASGLVETPVKFAYFEIALGRLGLAENVRLEIGRVRTPWIWFEEEIYRYRLQDGAFMDRLGFFSSADDGLILEGNFGALLPEKHRREVQAGSAGRFGSFALGLVRGNGIKDGERNDSWVFEGRATVRPWPDRLPGVQVSFLHVDGEGNAPRAPEWRVEAIMASFERRGFVATIQGTRNHGTQSGRAVDSRGSAHRGAGWSAFAEYKPARLWSAFLRHDWYDPQRDHGTLRFTRSIAGVALHAKAGGMLLLDVEKVRYAAQPERDITRWQLTAQVKVAPTTLAPPRAPRARVRETPRGT